MLTRIKQLVYGRCSTVLPTARQINDEHKHLWRRPFDIVPVPGHRGPDSVLYKVFFFLGFPPGWKFTIYQHNDTDPLPLHCHSGRILSFLLWGGYVEERLDTISAAPRRVWHRPFSVNWIPNETYHRVVELPRKRAYTFVVIFPTVQEPQYAVKGQSVNMLEYWRHGERAVTA